MIPTLDLGPLRVDTHGLFVVLGVTVAIVVLWARSRSPERDPRLPSLVAGGLLVGATFAKLGTGWQYLARVEQPTLLGLMVEGGQSVLGGLAGAYMGVVLTKRIIGYRGSTGDRFAPAVAAGLAVGRVGCFLTEQVGTPTSLPWGITVSPEVAATMSSCPSCSLGLPMHPSFLYEIAFHVLALVLLLRYGRSVGVAGDSFKLYLLAYALFRFGVEFVRDNPEMALGLSGSQLFLIATVPAAVAAQIWTRRTRSRLVLEPAMRGGST